MLRGTQAASRWREMADFEDDTTDEGLPTRTSVEQQSTEKVCREAFEEWVNADGSIAREAVPFNRAEHAAYLLSGLGVLAGGYVSLDSSRPWLCYWISHSLELLGEGYGLSGEAANDVASFLGRCQSPSGGFAGGPVPGQIPHLAPTYAAINTLVTIGTPAALGTLNRAGLKAFLRRMKLPNGAFTMHDDGECDVRGAYIAMVVGSLAGVLDDELSRGTAEWIASCQTYEGGIGSTPGEEAHGGYTFCGLAALVLLGKVELLDLPRLTHWLVARQMGVHGGFQGRTNKLVDGCYSFWQGGAFPLLQSVLTGRGELPAGGIGSLFSTDALLDYIFICCQVPYGGLRDKPGRGRDFYHTCYCLSGLAVAAAEPPPQPPAQPKLTIAPSPAHWRSSLGFVHPVYNISAPKVEAALKWFEQQPDVA